ncbi:MAG: hypothetical protein OEM46_10515 [Ignavibacteria bacterium]|nr:hypothetical protein [Ignavibacteria bacterium]
MMQRNVLGKFKSYVILIFIIIISISLSDALAGGKAGVYGIYMIPRGDDAEDFSRPGLGFGLHIVVPVPQLANILAGTAGLEFINLLSNTARLRDRTTGLLIDQETSQNYFRFFIGAQVGGHGNAFFRPHAGMNVALVVYSISTDLIVADSYTGEEIRQNVSSESHVVAGYDITLGIDLNFSNKFAIDGGVRYVKSFSVPQQLGEGSEKIHPQYFQVYLGIGLSFD